MQGRSWLQGTAALWVAVVLSLGIWAAYGNAGWDTAVYTAALHAVSRHIDPYQAATAIQVAFHQSGAVGTADPPYSYVYAPVTLPVLTVLSHLPLAVVAVCYWTIYALAAVAVLWVGAQFAHRDERRAVTLLAPVSLFFPGLLANGTLMGGNVAYLLYAAILLSMWRGIRTSRWASFYIAVLLSSCVKAPLLCMVALGPLLSPREHPSHRRWLGAGLTAIAGALVFLAQPLFCPALFQHYLRAVDLQFRFNHDFGCSPAGLVSELLDRFGFAYSPWGLICYAAYALPTLLVLGMLSKRYRDGRLSLESWLPVLLSGVVLLNPRLIEYDMAPLTIPLGLLTWRIVRDNTATVRAAAITAGGLFSTLNVVAVTSWDVRKQIGGVLLEALFLAGCMQAARNSEPAMTGSEQALHLARASG